MNTASTLPGRQVHLDFHTSGGIRGVGADFDAARVTAFVRAARTESMAVFARCHHGFSYHPTSVGAQHPGLAIDLLGAQLDALHGAGIRAPIYITVAWDELVAERHSEWLRRCRAGAICHSRPDDLTSWQFLDLASPHVDCVLAITDKALARVGLPNRTRRPEHFYGRHHAQCSYVSDFVAIAQQEWVA